MLYEPNTTHWVKGDVVIHWCDAKEPKMLMQVIGYTRDGLCKTQYIDRSHSRKVYTNEIQNLLDPRQFFKSGEFELNPRNIYLMNGEIHLNFDYVRRYNYYWQPNIPAILTKDLGEQVKVKTVSKAYLSGGSAYIEVDNPTSGGRIWLLERVKPESAIHE